MKKDEQHINKLGMSYEQVAQHKQVLKNSQTSYDQVMNKSLISHTSWANARVKLQSQVHFES